ncbi:MAG: septum formation initiator family protein [Treponema sp.]|jgi:cell division protein FtsB|nr:septum formation initiator family protein [Treponema sp.]
MRAIKYLAAFWVGAVVYVSFSISSGPAGLSAYRQLEDERDKQLANIEALELANRELETMKDSLLYDRDTLAVYAREQGFAGSEEKFIRIVGLEGVQKSRSSPGLVVSAAAPQYITQRNLQILSFCIAVSILICMGAYDLLQFLRSGES